MATYSSSLRSGLPRVEGGDPWPPEGTIGEPLEEGATFVAEAADTEELDEGSPAEAAETDVTDAEESTPTVEDSDVEEAAEESAAEPVTAADVDVPLRRGLPRVEGGEPWPPEGLAPAGVKATGGSAAPADEAVSAEDSTDSAEEPTADASEEISADDSAEESAAAAPAVAAAGAGAGAAVGVAAVASGSDDEDGVATEPAAAGASEVPLRRGLPRVAGGEPWPPEGFAPAGVKAAGASSAASSAAESAPAAEGSEAGSTESAAEAADTQTESASESSAAPAAAAAAEAGAAGAGVAAAAASSDAGSGELSDVPLRRGLPRTAGGDPWPPEGFAPASAAKPAAGATAASADAKPAEATGSDAAKPAEGAQSADAANQETKPAAKTAGDDSGAEKKPQGRRTGIGGVGAGAAAAGGGAAAGAGAAAAGAASVPEKKSEAAGEKKPAQRKPMGKPAAKAMDKPAQRKPMAKPAAKSAEKPAARTADTPTAKSTTAAKPAAKSTSSSSGGAASAKPAAKKEPIMIGSKSLGQWSKLVGTGLAGLIVVAGILILAARGVTTLPGVPEFLERYPGEYHIPDFVDPGFPAFARWTHYLNIFFMVLIIRTGLQVRHQQKPPAFYTPKKGGKKISINLWLHTSLDLLWLANGVVFVVLLFASGHWARIVPTSWEVFPNALSAALQYGTMEWPMEDAWVNYNALQQIMYFIVVFIAAPLAAITGVRMSEWWPKNATTLNKIYPAPLARAIHFPTMLFFVFFIIVHVFLVAATGFRQNLGYMFAGTDQLGWAGLIWLLVGLVVIVGAWFAARPLLLAPIANLFGRVSSR
jgi:thiosulfate reductase cytochrome b subunit